MAGAPKNRLPMVDFLELPLLNPTDDDLCPCGNGKRFKKCHGSDAHPASCAPVENPNLDVALLGLAENVLRVLRDAIDSVKRDTSGTEVEFRIWCLLYFSNKVHRSTLAGITLSRLGQATEAYALKRNQYYAWLSFQYFFINGRESILFSASLPLKQRDKLRDLIKWSKDVRETSDRQRHLAEKEEICVEAYQVFPDLKVLREVRPDGKPVYGDWSEPGTKLMIKSVVATWPEEMAKLRKPIPPDELDRWCREQAELVHFFHSTYPSQELHGTPMGLGAGLPRGDDDDVHISLSGEREEPNGVIYLYLGFALSVAEKLVEFSSAKHFRNRFIKLREAENRYQQYFNQVKS